MRMIGLMVLTLTVGGCSLLGDSDESDRARDKLLIGIALAEYPEVATAVQQWIDTPDFVASSAFPNSFVTAVNSIRALQGKDTADPDKLRLIAFAIQAGNLELERFRVTDEEAD